jgi:hypothetical protein
MRKEEGGNLDAYDDEPGEASLSTVLKLKKQKSGFICKTATQRKLQCYHGCRQKHRLVQHDSHLKILFFAQCCFRTRVLSIAKKATKICVWLCVTLSVCATLCVRVTCECEQDRDRVS